MPLGHLQNSETLAKRFVRLLFLAPLIWLLVAHLGAYALSGEAPLEEGQSGFADNFAGDTSLNTAVWTTSSSLLKQIAAVGEGGNQCGSLPNSFIPPTLGFGPNGMEMSGTNGLQQFTGIQSLRTFSAPFTLRTTVTATVANGNSFEIFLVSTDGREWFSLYGNINPANQPYVGIKLGCELFYQHTMLGVPYTIGINATPGGLFSVSLSDGSTTLATQTVQVGTGPFYLVLGQGEGWPNSGGTKNVAFWQSVSFETGGMAATRPTVSLYAPVVSGTTVSLNGVATPTTSGATITQIAWNWGDGSPQQIGWFPETHVYASAGTYSITVTASDSNGLVTSASVSAQVVPPLEVNFVAAAGEAATYTVIFPPVASVCASGSSLSAQTKATPSYCLPTYDYIQLAGPAVPLEGSTVTIEVTFKNTSASAQQAPGCISVTPQSSGNAGWWTFPATNQVTAPPVGTVFTSAIACTDGSSTNEASLSGNGTIAAGSTATVTYAGTPTWAAFSLEPEDGWSAVTEAVEMSLGVTDMTVHLAKDALGELPEQLATAGEVLGVASVAAETASFRNGLIDLGSVESVPWVTYSVQVRGGSPYAFEAYAQPEKMAILDALLWDLKWRMIPYVSSQPGLAASTLNGLENISLGTNDCVYEIVSAGGSESDGPPYSWFYNELENSAGDQIPSSASFHLGNYVNLPACSWTGVE